MAKYVCSVCGFVYDEEKGIPDKGIMPGTKFADLPEDWVCPLCGAAKDVFSIQEDKAVEKPAVAEEEHELKELSYAQKSALCSNLAKGCDKQYLEEEKALFTELADYYKEKAGTVDKASFDEMTEIIAMELKDDYEVSNAVSQKNEDRGALRALVWSEKVTRMTESLLKRFNNEKEAMLENTSIYVCEICGFIYVGNELPDICPVCKVPNKKIHKIERG